MSAHNLRNMVKRREYKERAQPAARQKLGLLEKKKDYKLRAKDYHSKEDRINALKQKASARNEDEFYFAMLRSETKDGVHQVQRTGTKRKFEDLVKIKEQDLSYLTFAAQKEAGVSSRTRREGCLGRYADLSPAPTDSPLIFSRYIPPPPTPCRKRRS